MNTRPFGEDPLEARVVVAGKAIRRAFDSGLAELGLNMSEGGALGYLAALGPLTQTEIAARLHIGRASSGALVDQLERRGLITRRADPTDRRVWHVVLTNRGAELAKRFEQRHGAVRSAIRDGLSPADLRALTEMLDRLAENASTYAESMSTDEQPAPLARRTGT